MDRGEGGRDGAENYSAMKNERLRSEPLRDVKADTSTINAKIAAL
jgi:hypothetical protein